MNTVFVSTEDTGSWKNYAGYFFLLLAVVDAFAIIRNLARKSGKVASEEK